MNEHEHSHEHSHEHGHEHGHGETSGREALEQMVLDARMDRIQHKVMVLSGKGGVGKSTFAANLAASLAESGKRVGLLDIDIHGPSIPKLFRLEQSSVTGGNDSINPAMIPFGAGRLLIMSMGLLLTGRDDAVIWRGPMKYGVIKQFLRDVEWGDLDYLIVDSPPGTGDEPLSIAQLVGKADGAVIVTTPQDLAIQDVRRCVTFCRKVDLPVLGVVENMSGFTCPRCGEVVNVFGLGGGRRMSEEMGVPFLGSIPLDPGVVTSGDAGRPIVQSDPGSAVSCAFASIVRKLTDREAANAGSTGQASGPSGK